MPTKYSTLLPSKQRAWYVCFTALECAQIQWLLYYTHVRLTFTCKLRERIGTDKLIVSSTEAHCIKVHPYTHVRLTFTCKLRERIGTDKLIVSSTEAHCIKVHVLQIKNKPC